MIRYFVLFKRKDGEKFNSYSLVSSKVLKNIPKEIIKGKFKVADEDYSKADLVGFVKELGGKPYVTA